MSLSLLNDYASSEESDNEEVTKENAASGRNSEDQTETKNFFIGSSHSDQSGSESSDGEEACTSAGGVEKDPTTAPLPRPFENYAAAGSKVSSVSVFRNPFLDAERAETSLLEQHVKLTETAYGSKLIDEPHRARDRFRRSSVPCRQFKRGRCRLGDKCGFLHAAVNSSSGESSNSANVSEAPVVFGGKAVRYTEWGKEVIVDNEDDEEKKRKKRRVGVTNSLIPPKKALSSYEKQRRSEAPWLDRQS